MEEARRVEEGFGHKPPSKKEDDHDKAYISGKVDRSDGGDCIDHEKEDRGQVLDDQPAEQKAEEQPLVKQKSKRVATLDAFRGLTIVVCIDYKFYTSF
jgi:heparan-alpha-glucosaminide N-acetyltransferase